jgi:uncharacterized RDD family membrane protein YckC
MCLRTRAILSATKVMLFRGEDTKAKMRRNSFTIRTAEGISFTQHVAGPVTRFLAFSVDLAAIAVISQLLGQFVLITSIFNPDVALAVRTVSYFAVSIGYSILLEWIWRGQTLGKRVLKIRVIDADGYRLRPAQIVIRNLLRVVDLLPALYAVGGVSCLISKKYQRIGDFAANTVVVYVAPEPIPNLELLFSGNYNSLRNQTHLAAQLRKVIAPEEARLALEAITRRAELEANSRLVLFRELAQHLRSIVAFPEESLEGLTDEQYVRNIVDLVYRPSGEGSNKNSEFRIQKSE